VEQLEKGEILWRRGWNCFGLPKNILTGNPYRGWNVFFLNFITLHHHYATPYFLTFHQAQQRGGRIKKGEKGYPVIYWAAIENKAERNKVHEEEQQDEQPLWPSVPLMPRLHTVFNIDQSEGICFAKAEKLYRSRSEKIEVCEQIIKNMPLLPVIEHRGDRAYYCPSLDLITIPKQELFFSDEAYYNTLFHELAHSSGHVSRLNRKEVMHTDGFGRESYSKEELTAELTSAFLCGICQMQPTTLNNSAAYIQGWLTTLNKDKTLLLKAATQAQAAADYILNMLPLVNESAVPGEEAAA
jgi:antirestriction protein ArdC